MGYRMIAAMSGFRAEQAVDRIRVRDDRWNGYLANISPDEFGSQFEMKLPEHMLGEDFLAQFGGITDSVTRVHPDHSYPVRQATAHPIRENARVERFAALLGTLAESPAAASKRWSQLMYASHASYSACGLGQNDGTDRSGADGAQESGQVRSGLLRREDHRRRQRRHGGHSRYGGRGVEGARYRGALRGGDGPRGGKYSPARERAWRRLECSCRSLEGAKPPSFVFHSLSLLDEAEPPRCLQRRSSKSD